MRFLRLMIHVLGFFLISSVASVGLAQPNLPSMKNSFPGMPVPETKQDETSWEGGNSHHSFIILLDEQKTTLSGDWSFQVVSHLMIKIQREDPSRWSEIPVYYNTSSDVILRLDAKVISPDGKIQKFEKIEDLDAYEGFPLYGNYKIKNIHLPQAGFGSIIDLRIEKKIKRGPLENQFAGYVAFPRSPTKLYKSTFVFPLRAGVEFKSYKRKDSPTISRDQSTVTYYFEQMETEDPAKEDYSPAGYDLNGFAMFSSLKNWKAIADGLRDQMKKNLAEDPKLTGEVNTLIQGKKTQKEKVRAILEFLQDNFRYVPTVLGEGFWQFHSVSEVFNPLGDKNLLKDGKSSQVIADSRFSRNKYANSQDWTLLAHKMLMSAGISSNICLASEDFDGSPKDSLPNLAVFSHAILEVFVDGQKYFVDPLLRGYDLGQFSLNRQSPQLLVITEDGYRLDQIAGIAESENSIVSHTDVYLEEDGKAILKVNSQWGVDAGISLKEAWRYLQDNQKEEFYSMLDKSFAREGEMLERVWEGLDNRYGGIVSTLRFKRPEAYLLLNDSLVLAESPKTQPRSFLKNTRKNPIFFPHNSIVKSTITYHIPKGFGVDLVPEGYDFKKEGIEISRSFTREPGLVKMTDIFRTKRAFLGVEKFQELKEMWDQIEIKNNQFVILKKEAK